MKKYLCDCCKFSTNLSPNYSRHILTKKHVENQKLALEKQKLALEKQKLALVIPVLDIPFTCKYCEQNYKHKSSLSKHIKYNCIKNKDEDVKELVRLLNLKVDTQAKQIEKLMDKLQIQNNIIHGNIIQNNIQLLAYNDSDISHLTEKDYSSCIKQVNFCVKKLIEKIHFNPAKPENMNIYISNLKDKYLMLYENGNWNIKNKNVLERVYEDKEMMLDQWLDEEQYKYPELKEKFVRYLNNKEKDDTLNMIKEEIKMMIYNKTKETKFIEN